MVEPLDPPWAIVQRHELDSADLALRIPPDLMYFEGHFPGYPILPGVVQLDLAFRLGRTLFKLEIEAAKKFQVKFKSVIRPGDEIALAFEIIRLKQRLSFLFSKNGDTCSSGWIGISQ